MPPTRSATNTLRVVAARPTTKKIRASKIRRLRRSRPNWSVPRRCRDGGALQPVYQVEFVISHTGSTHRQRCATTIKIRMMSPLIVPSGFSCHSRMKKSANRPRRSDSLIPHPRVQIGINQVDEEIEQHHPGGEKQVDSGNHGVVSCH